MALLCAAEQDCMVPNGQTQSCISTPITPNLTCHRQDQSLFDILLYNLEYRQQIEDPSFLAHISRTHPRWSSKISRIFRVRRGQTFAGTPAEWAQLVKCC
ncbi:hypothetical protein niasHT_000465 [Heterodera trifolii]|uniref:Uncharacterized protein n=1 Tax=Heterodera trifolii TaxID=157864 RepID=A0ABD2LYV3_9BILA